MINSPGEMLSLVRVQKPVVTGSGASKITTWIDVGNDSVGYDPNWLNAKWENVHGSEAWMASSVQASAAATVSVWYNAEISQKCRILTDSGTIYQIVSIDDVRMRHEQIELKVKAAVSG